MRPIFGAWEANDIAMWRCVVRWLRRPILVVGLDRFRFAAIAALFALLLGPRMHGINFARRSLPRLLLRNVGLSRHRNLDPSGQESLLLAPT